MSIRAHTRRKREKEGGRVGGAICSVVVVVVRVLAESVRQ